jgi:MFS family permease
MPEGRHPTLEVLAIPAVRLYVVARFFAHFGRSLAAAMLSYHVYDVAGSAAALGVLGLVEFLPVVPVALLGGAVADRFDRRWVMLLSNLGSLAGVTALAWASLGAGVGAPDGAPVGLALLYGAAFVLAAAAIFGFPAASALLPALVPRHIFQNATVVTSSISQLAFITGPITMGFLAEFLGFWAPYALAAGCHVVAVVCLLRLRVASASTTGERGGVSLAAVREGLAFVRSRRAVFSSMTLDMIAVGLASATALLPVFANDILGVGVEGYGLLRASIAVGTFAMTVLLMIARPFARPGRALLWAVFAYGVAMAVFGLSRWFPLSVLAYVVAGMADQVSMTTRSVIIQLSTPDVLRGRVSAVNSIFISASNELGDAEAGFLASLTSATFAVVFGAVACLGFTAWTTTRVPALRDYRPGSAGVA